MKTLTRVRVREIVYDGLDGVYDKIVDEHGDANDGVLPPGDEDPGLMTRRETAYDEVAELVWLWYEGNTR